MVLDSNTAYENKGEKRMQILFFSLEEYKVTLMQF